MLGDIVSKALASVGVTPERVSELIGVECGCAERRRKLNALSHWAVLVVRGRLRGRELEALREMLEDAERRKV